LVTLGKPAILSEFCKFCQAKETPAFTGRAAGEVNPIRPAKRKGQNGRLVVTELPQKSIRENQRIAIGGRINHS
jgi:hypothetical protein